MKFKTILAGLIYILMVFNFYRVIERSLNGKGGRGRGGGGDGSDSEDAGYRHVRPKKFLKLEPKLPSGVNKDPPANETDGKNNTGWGKSI